MHSSPPTGSGAAPEPPSTGVEQSGEQQLQTKTEPSLPKPLSTTPGPASAEFIEVESITSNRDGVNAAVQPPSPPMTKPQSSAAEPSMPQLEAKSVPSLGHLDISSLRKEGQGQERLKSMSATIILVKSFKDGETEGPSSDDGFRAGSTSSLPKSKPSMGEPHSQSRSRESVKEMAGSEKAQMETKARETEEVDGEVEPAIQQAQAREGTQLSTVGSEGGEEAEPVVETVAKGSGGGSVEGKEENGSKKDEEMEEVRREETDIAEPKPANQLQQEAEAMGEPKPSSVQPDPGTELICQQSEQERKAEDDKQGHQAAVKKEGGEGGREGEGEGGEGEGREEGGRGGGGEQKEEITAQETAPTPENIISEHPTTSNKGTETNKPSKEEEDKAEVTTTIRRENQEPNGTVSLEGDGKGDSGEKKGGEEVEQTPHTTEEPAEEKAKDEEHKKSEVGKKGKTEGTPSDTTGEKQPPAPSTAEEGAKPQDPATAGEGPGTEKEEEGDRVPAVRTANVLNNASTSQSMPSLNSQSQPKSPHSKGDVVSMTSSKHSIHSKSSQERMEGKAVERLEIDHSTGQSQTSITEAVQNSAQQKPVTADT